MLTSFSTIWEVDRALDILDRGYSIPDTLNWSQAAFDRAMYWDPSSTTYASNTRASVRYANGDQATVYGSNLTSGYANIARLEYSFYTGEKVTLVGAVTHNSYTDETGGYITEASLSKTTKGTTTLLGKTDVNGNGAQISKAVWSVDGAIAEAQGTLSGYTWLSNGYYRSSVEGIVSSAAINANGMSLRLNDISFDSRIDYENSGQALSIALNGNDTIRSTGNSIDLFGIGGNDTLIGDSGINKAIFSGPLSNYSIRKTGADFVVNDHVGQDGNDKLINIEKVQFTDKLINLTIQEAARKIDKESLKVLSELYVAFFNRTPDADGLEYWINQHQNGQTLNLIAESFYTAGVQYSHLTGYTTSMSNANFINMIYKNVLGRKDGADSDGLSYWTEKLESGKESKASLISSILSSAHSFKGDAQWGWVADLLDNKAAVAHHVAIDLGLNYLNPDEAISKGMQIAAAVTPTDINAAISLIGVDTALIQLG